MKKLAFFLLIVVVLSVVGCGQRRHDVAYYEQKVDSIRKAEAVGEMQRKAGIHSDPVIAFFDTLSRRPLPLQSVGTDLERLGSFARVPAAVADWLGYPSEARLKALRLPYRGELRVALLAEMVDSVTPSVYLYTFDRQYHLVDQLCVYEEKAEDRLDDYGKSVMEYFITSDYEITLLQYFVSRRSEVRRLETSRRFVINGDGHFEEVVIEL